MVAAWGTTIDPAREVRRGPPLGDAGSGGGRRPGGLGRLGRYELLEPLGAGGMAEVFRARSVGPGGFERQVVIKRILPHSAGDPELVAMFVDEAKILGLLHHPNVVQVYDFGEAEGTLFLALEYVDGPSLSRVMRDARSAQTRLPPAFVAHVAHEVCRALDYVHNLRDADGEPLDVVHRDVTPSNVMLTATAGVKLLDFGVAKYASSGQATRHGSVKGKPAYLAPEQIAPEQIEGKGIDGRVDLFALGVVMYEMLMLDHLFLADGDLATMRNVLERPIRSPASQRPDVPADLDAIVMKALARNRDVRFASAAEMARALQELLVSRRFHVEDAAALLAELGGQGRGVAAAPRAPIARGRHTRKDIALPLRIWGRLLLGSTRTRWLLAGAATLALLAAAALLAW
jgi:serine/threonine protein kinase